MDFALTANHESIRDAVAKICARFDDAYWLKKDKEGGYPADFLDTLAVGEQSGKMVESMGTLARQYQDRARMAMTALAVVAGVAVMLLIAGLIIAMIFRIFITSYLGPINEALKMKA